jgi:hypothetical protein
MKTSVTVVLIFGMFQFLCAQPDTTRKHLTKKTYWLDLGLGWGGQGSAIDIGLTYEMVPQRTISVRYSGVVTNHRYYDYLFVIPVANYPGGEDADAYEISYGILGKGKVGIMNLSAGLSLVKIKSGTGDGPPIGFNVFGGSDRPVDYELTKSNTVGLALRAQFVPSLRWAGLGISPYININPKYTFASMTFQLALGRIKPKLRKLKPDLLKKTQ